MIFSRGTGVNSHIKLIIGMMICLLTVITGTANKIEPNVTLDVSSEVTTQSTEINFVLENKGSATIRQGIWLKSFEKKVDGQWQEMPFNVHINDEDVLYKTSPKENYFFPNEIVECNFKVRYLLSDGEEMTALDAGDYKATFGIQYDVRTGINDIGRKVVFASCEFEVKEA